MDNSDVPVFQKEVNKACLEYLRDDSVDLTKLPKTWVTKNLDPLKNKLSSMDSRLCKNEAIIKIIKRKFPDINYKLGLNKNNKSVFQIYNYPIYLGRCPSLTELLICNKNQLIQRATAEYLQQELVCEDAAKVAFKVSKEFRKLGLQIKKKDEYKDIYRVINKAISGNVLTFIFPVCPDYSYKETGDLDRPYEYTFQSVGSGIGLVARKAIETYKRIEKICNDLGISFEAYFVGGDFEMTEESQLQQMNITREGFLSKLDQSLRAIEKDIGSPNVYGVRMSTLCGGMGNFEELRKSYEENFLNGDWGYSNLSTTHIDRILIARKSLYEKWCSAGDRDFDYHAQLCAQASEYAAMGHVFLNNFSNMMVVGCDHYAMRPFYKSLSADIPVLYLSPYYK